VRVTRLRTDDIAGLAGGLDACDRRLRRQTGSSLLGVACRAARVSEQDVAARLAKGLQVAVIPVTSGGGVIGGFSETVCGIASHIGADAYVTTAPDVAGLAEAYERKADVLMLSDDDRFVAINTRTRRVSDNSELTARGFVAGLDLMTGGLRGRRVLVLGCGPVGRGAAKALVSMGADVALCDIEPRRSRALAEGLTAEGATSVRIEADLKTALRHYRVVFDATPAGDIIDADSVTEETFAAGPGVPCGFTAAAVEKLGLRLIHDPLQTGVAAMLADAIAPQGSFER
jgi:pyrrolysine biosynthesis protein PylD